MGLLTWVRGLTRGPEPTAPVGAAEPLPPHLAQQQRILTKVAAYRAQLQREAAARVRQQEAREAQEWAQRQEAWEDEVARGLALRQTHFPGDDMEEAHTPQVEFIPLAGYEDEAGPRYGWFRFPR